MRPIKNLLLCSILATAFTAPVISHAQIVTTYAAAKSTLTNADTTTVAFSIPPADVVSFIASITRASGTAAGTIALQGSRDGTTWTTVGSAYTIVNAAVVQTVFEPTKMSWVYYRLYILASGTWVGNTIKGYTLRRTGKIIQ